MKIYDCPGGGALLEEGAESQIQDGRIALMDRRLVEDGESHLLRNVVGTLHFDEGVDVAHRRNKIRKEWLPFALQFQNLRTKSASKCGINKTCSSFFFR